MFGGSYFGESPFASPPVSARVVRRVVKWLAGGPGGLWNAMRARSEWDVNNPTENDQAHEPGSGWSTDTPKNDWETGDL